MSAPPAIEPSPKATDETPLAAITSSGPAAPSEPIALPEVKPEETVTPPTATTAELPKEALTSTVTSEAVDELPPYALQYAPIVYLDETEQYFPGLPSDHVTYTMPYKFTGEAITVPDEHKGKLSMLALEEVNKPDVFLTMHHIRKVAGDIAELKHIAGKPDSTGKSKGAVWIVVRNKTGLADEKGLVEEGVIEDVFYFFFYPYNLGNTVLFQHFGNHVGDWEHAMIRFRNGKPQAMHLSAHSDGNSWNWDCFEKKGDRPVIYSAAGSHANYPMIGTHDYSGVLLVGPSDRTSTGFLWDPTLNFVVGRSFDTSTDTAAGGPSSKFGYMSSSAPGHNKSFSPEDVVTVLSYQGRWGNSFSDLRQTGNMTATVMTALTDLDNKATSKITAFLRKLRLKKAAENDASTLRAAEEAVINGESTAAVALLHKESKAGRNIMLVSPFNRLLVLIWAEGPTGPRDKSLERHTMNRWKAGILVKM